SVRLLEDAAAALAGADSGLRARVLAGLARALHFAGAHERALLLSAEAVELARRIGDTAAQVYALSAHRMIIWGPDHLPERLAVASELLELARAADDREGVLEGLRWRITALLERGDAPAADEAIAAYAREAE